MRHGNIDSVVVRKSSPAPSDAHVDAALTDISIAYVQNQENFVADKIFPGVGVQKQTDKYFKFTKNDWFRDDAVTKRAPEGESSGSGFPLSTDNYSADVWATHVDINDQLRANADPAVPVEDAAAELCMQRMLIRKERQFATDYFATSIWGTDVVGGTNFAQWDDAASDPENDIDTGKRTILTNTGMEPNTLLVSYGCHQALKRHPLIKDRIKYTSSESVTAAIIAKFFELDRYFVAKGVYATNNEGAAEAYSFALGKNALLCYVAPTPGIMIPSAGYTFSWAGLTGNNNMGIATSTLDMRPTGRKIDRVESEMAFDMKVVGSDLGYFFSSVVS